MEPGSTYILTESGMTYLMRIKNTFIKEWLGYHYTRSCIAKDAIRSAEKAIIMEFNGSVPEGLILRTDNAPQYISQEFRSAMKLLGIRVKCIQKHTPENISDTEPSHNSINTDYIWPNESRDFHEASTAIEKAFSDYNEFRLHSSNGYLLPRVFRWKFLNDLSFRERFERKKDGVIQDEN